MASAYVFERVILMIEGYMKGAQSHFPVIRGYPKRGGLLELGG